MRKITPEEISDIISGALPEEPVFRCVDFREATDLDRCDFYRADMAWSDFRGVDLHGCSMRLADLSHANFGGSDMKGADLSAANLCYAKLENAFLDGACLCRASMHGADMTGAELTGADLRWSIGNGNEIRSFQLGYYHVVICITHNVRVMAIGCQQHSIDDWMRFDDDDIEDMDGKAALKWWGKYKAFIENIIDNWDIDED